MSLNVSTFEGNIDLTTIPANRQFVFGANTPFPKLLIGSNQDKAIKKIEAGFNYEDFAPNNNIVITDWSLYMNIQNIDRSNVRPIRGSVSTVSSGVFNNLSASSTAVFVLLSQKCPLIDYEENYILAGGLQLISGFLIFSNTTTPLNTVPRFFINVYWEELCN